VIAADDFAEAPPAGWKRLAPGRVVRLRHAGCVRCDEVIKDAAGAVIELRCTLLPEPVTEKVAGVIHWVSASRGVRCEVRLYDRLFAVQKPDAAEDVTTVLNPKSLEIVTTAIVEPAVVARAKAPIQLERIGYFIADEVDSRPDALVLNRVITLRDSWAAAAAEAAPVVAKKSALGDPPRQEVGPRVPRRGPSPRRGAGARHAAAVDALGADAADLLHGDRATSDFADAAIAAAPAQAKALARWLVNEVPRALGDDELAASALTPAALAALVGLCEAGTITAAVGKELLAELATQGGDPVALVDARGLRQVAATDDLAPIIAAVLAANPAKVAEYRGGKAGLLGFFVGQVMKATGGKANPASVNQLVAAALSAG
jgi:glutaminyl-tRNA synthetase